VPQTNRRNGYQEYSPGDKDYKEVVHSPNYFKTGGLITGSTGFHSLTMKKINKQSRSMTQINLIKENNLHSKGLNERKRREDED